MTNSQNAAQEEQLSFQFGHDYSDRITSVLG